MWEHFAHQADIGVRGTGSTIDEAFEQVALALTAVITDLDKIACDNPVNITCRAENAEKLLFDWLSAVIYEMDARKMLFGKFRVQIQNKSLAATAWGEKINPDKHQPSSKSRPQHIAS